MHAVKRTRNTKR